MSPLFGSRMRSSYSLLHPISLAICIISIVASSRVVSQTSIFDTMASNSTCDELDCKNGNSCHMSISNNGSTWPGHTAHCACRGKWAGPNCELELRLFVYSIQSEFVSLGLQQVSPPPTDSHTSQPKIAAIFEVKEFSIFLWNMNSLNVCRIFQMNSNNLELGKIRLRGLERGEKYLACFSNSHIDSCSFFSHKNMEYLSKEQTCVELAVVLHDTNSLYMQVVATVCVIAVFVLVLCMFVYVHRRIFVVQLCLHILFCRSCRRCRTIPRTKKNEDTRRMRKQMRDVSGDVLMPDDIFMEFDEFEGENDLSSPMYSCESLGMEGYTADSTREFCDLKLLPPRRPTSLDIKFRLPEHGTTENCDFLYENQKLISPIYSPQDHNVMKLAFLEDDLISGYVGGQDHQGDLENLNFGDSAIENRFQPPQIGGQATEFQRYDTLQTEFPFHHRGYLPESKFAQHPKFSSQTLPRSFMRKPPGQFLSHGIDVPYRRRSLYSHQDPDLLLSTLATPHQGFKRGIDTTYHSHNISSFPLPTSATKPQHDTSPEIEYSDASGDYRYPPVLANQTLPHRNKTFTHHPARSFTAHDIKMRNLRFPRTRKHDRPRSLPIDYFLLQHELAVAPINLPGYSPLEPTHHNFSPNFDHFNYLHTPSSYIPNADTFRQKTCQYATDTNSFAWHGNHQQSRTFLSRDPPLDLPSPLSVQLQPRSELMYPSLNTLPRAKKPQSSYDIGYPEEANHGEAFSSHSLPRLKKPKLSYDLSPLEEPNKTGTFSSHSLPRVKKTKPTGTSKLAKRPHRLNLRPQTLNFSAKPKTSPTAFQMDTDTPQNSTESFPNSILEESFSLPTSPLKPPSSMKTLLGHFENNLFSRTAISSKRSENQEFLDLQSPLTEDRTKPTIRQKAKKLSKWAINRINSKADNDFTYLADDSYKCFFKTDNNLDLDTKEDENCYDISSTSSILQNGDGIAGKSSENIAKILSTTKSCGESSSTLPLVSRAGSISCFAENTVNLVTPFCAEVNSSPALVRHDRSNYLGGVAGLSISKAIETKQKEIRNSEGNTNTNMSEKSKTVENCGEVEIDFDEDEFINREPKEWEVIV